MRVDPEDYAFVAQFSPMSLARTAATLGQQVRSRLLSVFFGLLIVGVLWFSYGRPTSGFGAAVLLGMLCVPIAWLVATLLRLGLVKGRLASIMVGPALRVDPLGLVIADANGPVRVPWDQVGGLGTKAHMFLPGPELVVKRTGAPDWRVPFSYLDVLPGTIDSAIRAHTGGRRSLSTTPLDRFI
jgi:hypothetical protein